LATPAIFGFEGVFPAVPAVPAGMLETTTRASLLFIARSSNAITLGSSKPVILARGVLYSMMFSRLKVSAIAAIGAFLIAASAGMLARQDRANSETPQAPTGQENAVAQIRELVPFQKAALNTDDLVEAAGLDIYKFNVELAKGESFKVVLRVCESKESPSREIVGRSFKKTFEKPTTVRVSFLRRDRKLSGFLLSDEAEAEYRLSCAGGATGGIATIVKNPLGQLDPTRRGLLIGDSDKENALRGERETVLLRVCENRATRGVDVGGYPRGEGRRARSVSLSGSRFPKCRAGTARRGCWQQAPISRSAVLMARASLKGKPSAHNVVVTRTATSFETLGKPAASSPCAHLGPRRERPSQRHRHRGHIFVPGTKGQAIDIFVISTSS
jgi:hypothetical protein